MTQEGSSHKFNNLGAQCYPLKCLGVQWERRVGTQSQQYRDSSIMWSFSTRPSYDLDVLMSKYSYQHALSTRNGHVKVNLDVMTTALSMLKDNPSLPARKLRPLLKSALPSVTVLDSKYLNNFR